MRVTAVVAFLLVAAPLAVDGQPSGQPIHTVGVLMPQNVNVYPSWAAFVETLQRLGYHEGGNLRIVLRSAEGKLDRLPTLAAELVSARVDVIVALNTPGTRAAIRATKQIPIVMTEVGDPVGTGFVSNLRRPGGNVTGVSNMVGELAAKRLAVMKEAVPRARRIAALFNPEDPITAPQLRDAERAASVLKVETRFFPVKAIEDLHGTFNQMLAWRADAAVWILGQQHAFQAVSIALAASHRLRSWWPHPRTSTPVALSRTPMISSNCMDGLRRSSIESSKARSQVICRSSSPQSSNWLSTSRRPRRSGSLFLRRCCHGQIALLISSDERCSELPNITLQRTGCSRCSHSGR